MCKPQDEPTLTELRDLRVRATVRVLQLLNELLGSNDDPANYLTNQVAVLIDAIGLLDKMIEQEEEAAARAKLGPVHVPRDTKGMAGVITRANRPPPIVSE